MDGAAEVATTKPKMPGPGETDDARGCFMQKIEGQFYLLLYKIQGKRIEKK